jgi:hypothetical protein
MTPAKNPRGTKKAAKKTAGKPTKRTGAAKKAAKKSTRKAAGKSTKKAAKKTAKKGARKSTTKPARKTTKKAAKKSTKKAAGKAVRKSTKKAAKKPAKRSSKRMSPSGRTRGAQAVSQDGNGPLNHWGERMRSLSSQDLIHGLAAGLVRIGDGMDRARDEVVAGAALARRAATSSRKRIQEAGSSARGRLHETRDHAVEATGGTIATARGISVGTLMKMGDARDAFLVRLADGTEELAERARVARDKGQDFYARHREEIIALTITAIKIAAVIGVRRLTAPRKKKDGEEGTTKGDVVAIVGNLLGQVGKLLAHQPSALPLLREVYRKGDPGEQAVVGLLLAPTLHQDPEHAMEVIEEFLEGASEEPAADTIARRTLAPLLKDHPELMETVVSWMRAAGPLVKRGALIALSNVLRDRRSRLGDVVAAAVIVLEDHDEEVREAASWFMQTASDVDLELTARTIADWVKARGADVEEVVMKLPDPLKRRVRDLVEEDGPSGWDA